MEGPIYTRDYLTELPAKTKREQQQRGLLQIMGQFNQELHNAAKSGKKSYLYDMTHMEYVHPSETTDYSRLEHTGKRTGNMNCFSYSIPMDELIPLFQERFPGCQVTYKEEWVDTTSNTKTLKKGICIDWS